MKRNTLKDTFLAGTPFKYFLVSVLLAGLAFGLNRGMLDNYLAEVIHMGEMDKGITEFFRELPGVALIFILAAFYMLSAEAVFKIGALVMMIGMAMHSLLPPDKVLITIAICTFSLGEHLQLGMKSAISLQYARPGKGGEAQGVQNAYNQIGTLIGYLVIVAAFTLIPGKQPYSWFYALGAVLLGVSALMNTKLKSKSTVDSHKRRFYFHKKYIKYYMLEMFYGARKQVFITFAPFALVRFYGASTATVSLLFAISAVACFLLAPLIGKIIDKLGYKFVMVADTIVLVFVCLMYGFAHRIFGMEVAFIVCCINYILDAVISMASMASNVYVQKLSDNDEEMKATISTGVSINHVISVLIALFGGWIWQTLGIETLFIVSAILGLCNSAYAASIKNVEKA
ncbi:MAG: MFS transporter [Oscillospiraceae bacterium]|nr:MFS transporter [Oscillospiraceae bacterium]